MKISLAHRLSAQTVVATCLVLAQGCAHMERAEYDPCAHRNTWRDRSTGPLIVACYNLAIPFRARVVDAATGAPLAAVAVLRGQNAIEEPITDGPALGWSSPDGEVDLAALMLVGTPNPYSNACFRRDFPGILIEFQQDGYAQYRCRVPLPAAEGEIADLGVIQLIANQE